MFALALLDPGDECVIPAPYWVSYPDMALARRRRAGRRVWGRLAGLQDHAGAACRGDHAAHQDVHHQQSEQSDRSGLYEGGTSRRSARFSPQHPQIVIASDEMYEHIYWAAEPYTSFAQANPKLYERTITINGVSKAYAMTGWRIGYCGAPKEIVTAMSTVQGQSTSNASSISQRAATVALNGDQSCVAEMNKAFKARHDFVVAGLNAIPGVSCLRGAGTFYAFAQSRRRNAHAGHERRQCVCRVFIGGGRCRRCAGIRFRRAESHAPLLCMQHGDTRGRTATHRASRRRRRSRSAPEKRCGEPWLPWRPGPASLDGTAVHRSSVFQ